METDVMGMEPMTEPEPEKDEAPAPRRRPVAADPDKPKRSRSASPRRGRKKPDDLETPIRLMLETVGGVWATSESLRVDDEGKPVHASPTCGEVLTTQAPQIARSLAVLAAEDPSVYKWLAAATTGGGWGGVAFTVLPVVQSIVYAHALPAIARRAERRGLDLGEEGWQGPITEQIPPDQI